MILLDWIDQERAQGKEPQLGHVIGCAECKQKDCRCAPAQAIAAQVAREAKWSAG